MIKRRGKTKKMQYDRNEKEKFIKKILKERNEWSLVSNESEVREGKVRNTHLIWEQVC